MVLDDYWISWMNLSSLVVEKYRLFVELMHLSKSSELLSWKWTFLVAVLFAVIFFASYFSLLFAATCLYCATLTAVRYITKFEWGFILVLASSFISFTFFCLIIIIVSLFISWRDRIVLFCNVSYAAAWRIIFFGDCWVLPFARIITIGLLGLVTCNSIGASVSYVILSMPFGDVWTEAKHAYAFVIMLGGPRGSRWVLAKISLVMFPDDTVKYSHV